jgi:hypothetical protein
VRVEGGDGRIGVTEIDLELTEVLTVLKKISGVGMAQGVHVRVFFDAAGLESQAEASLQGRPTERASSGGRSGASSATFGREQERGMPMSLPLLAEQFQGALRQGHIAVAVAFATPDVEEHAFGVDVAHLQTQAFTQAEPRRNRSWPGKCGDQSPPL